MKKLIVVLLALCWGCKETMAATPGPPREEWIQSILVRRDVIFASCPKGLYRASTTHKKWERLNVEDRTPLDGFFAESASTSSAIYYYTPQWVGWKMPSANTKTFGLYRYDPTGGKWELLSTEYDFKHIYVHEDGKIYAIVGITEKKGGQTSFYDRILLSKDSGKHWEDISHDLGCGIGLFGIFQDPDHKKLVCLKADCLRDYVLQANDEGYKWNLTQLWDWYAKHSPKEAFFEDEYSTGTTLFMHRATLSNYFDYPFGNRAQIHSFRIAVGGRRDFKPKEPIVLPVEIVFWYEGDASATLLDTEHGNACWGLNRILPDGTQQRVPIAKGVDRGSLEVKLHRLTHRQSYKRLLDLSAMCDFSKPGTYRVQLLYDDGWIADKNKGDWLGSFLSPVFVIKISQ